MKFILFDVDGTLLYSNRIDSQCFATAYEVIYGEPFPTIDWTNFSHVTDTTIFREVIHQHFGRALEEGERERFEERYVALLRAKRAAKPEVFREVPGARAMVDHLMAQEDVLVGIGTGGWLVPAQVKLTHIGVPHEELIVSAANGHTTRESILGAAIAQAQAHAGSLDRVVYIGDAVWDVTTTRNMGIDFIGIRRQQDTDTLLSIGAREVLVDFRDQDLFLNALERAQPQG
jgi:phosphoglycolate phosphatase-like HAD superfamily hydrolase